tara:strand:+ start:126 stop:545 length:420 start_codon:yes stop_codon:yes gene_type:complete
MIFEYLLKYAQNKEERYIYGSMLQFETEAKAVMRPLLLKLDLPIGEEIVSRERGIEIGLSLKEIPFKELMKDVEKSIENHYLPLYEELESLADEEEAEECFVSKFMGDHERALLLTAQNFILDKDDSIKPITSMLRFPL